MEARAEPAIAGEDSPIWPRWLVSSHRVPSMGANAFRNSFGSASAMTLTLAIFVGQVAPAGADRDGVADLEAIEARDRKPHHNERMLADDLDRWLAPGAPPSGG
jgi:hypothetical protein